jgi:hypothetical protein
VTQTVGRNEVAIHPLSKLGSFDSCRANGLFKAAGSVLPVLIDGLNAELPLEEAPARLEPAA